MTATTLSPNTVAEVRDKDGNVLIQVKWNTAHTEMMGFVDGEWVASVVGFMSNDFDYLCEVTEHFVEGLIQQRAFLHQIKHEVKKGLVN